MSAFVAGVETGGTKILARVVGLESGETLLERRWKTGSADEAAAELTDLLSDLLRGSRLRALGIGAFGPLIVDPESPDYGRMLATPKPGWAGSNLRAELEGRLGIPVAVDTDVNAAAIAEQAAGAGARQHAVAYVTVGTGIGAGLALAGRSLRGAMHPEAGHFRLVRQPADEAPSICPFHADCAEGLVSGPALRRRLGEGRELCDDPALVQLVAGYLGQLAAALVLAWSPHRIVWGGGVMKDARLLSLIAPNLRASLGGYGAGRMVEEPDFCVPAMFEHAGLEGALMMARELVP